MTGESFPESQQLLVSFARLEGKVDLTLSEITSLKTTDADHETRLRFIEKAPVPDPDTAKRLSELENRRTVSPGQLWAGLLGVVALIGSGVAIISGVQNIIN